MRLSTLASVAAIGLSTAVIAQVRSTPVVEEVGRNNMVDMPDMAPDTTMPGNGSARDLVPNNTSGIPDATDGDAAPAAGDPTAATSAPPKP